VSIEHDARAIARRELHIWHGVKTARSSRHRLPQFQLPGIKASAPINCCAKSYNERADICKKL
jgi:hypothetical protein